ncbi:thiamine pyrophosphokinase [Shivajiella indica]|uniref:Thiamine pyrophosphokinase n=1 Tax=Shivajiella indica TaxID=872115 RepID=A0ABW5BDI7_9BACT
MSSHHFVKEQQEPALVILDTTGIHFDQIAPLLEWVPTVLVSQEEAYTVISWGIKIDLILADLEFQKSNFHLLEEQYPVKFLGVKEGQFLEESLQYLIATKHSAANIIGFDHRNLYKLESMLEFLDLVVWDGNIRYFPVKTGQFRKWFTSCTIQLYALENTLIEIRNTAGSRIIPIKHATMVNVPEGISEFHSKGIFWIGEIFNIET